MPRGGPDGGDGGHGGSMLLGVTEGLPSAALEALRHRGRIVGNGGGRGERMQRRGKDGENLVVPVPLGTEVVQVDAAGEEHLLADLAKVGQHVLVAYGGRGGRGNRRFVGSTNRVPLLAEAGEQGEEVSLRLRLKLLADVGVVGRPNAGKSSLLTAVSAARPRVAAHPFTTTEPVLAVVEGEEHRFVAAEVPGLVEGAHRGVGLGFHFLRHAERTRLLLHLVDGTSADVRGDLEQVNAELQAYNPDLASRPQIVAVNKVDLPEVSERIGELRRELRGVEGPVAFVSALTGEGMPALVQRVAAALGPVAERPRRRRRVEVEVIEPERFQPRRPRIEREAEERVRVHWAPLERIVDRVDLEDSRVIAQLRREMVRMGVVRMLESFGLTSGETLCIGGRELEWR